MDPITFGLGALTGIIVDHTIDALSRRYFWSDEQKALRAAYQEQQKDALVKGMHEKLIALTDKRIEKLEKKRVNALGTRAIAIDGKMASLKLTRARLIKEGPKVLEAPTRVKDDERKGYETPASEMVVDVVSG